MVWESVLAVVRDAGGTVTAKRAVSEGVRWEDLYRLRDEGALIELSRGVFRLGDAPPSAHLDLLAVCRRVPHGVICLGSAFAYWELSDSCPPRCMSRSRGECGGRSSLTPRHGRMCSLRRRSRLGESR